MWFLKKNPLFFLIWSVFWGCISTSATSTLRTTSGSFNETGLTDIRADSNSLDPSLNDATLQGEKQLRRRLLDTSASGENNKGDPIRILYTVTTLAEYDKGTRATTRGFDRLKNLLIPVVKEGVQSMVAKGYHVDVYIISYYEMTRKSLVTSAMEEVSSDISVSFWDNAAPISYDPMKRDKPDAKLWENTLGLARQHRFVVKDNLFADTDLSHGHELGNSSSGHCCDSGSFLRLYFWVWIFIGGSSRVWMGGREVPIGTHVRFGSHY